MKSGTQPSRDTQAMHRPPKRGNSKRARGTLAEKQIASFGYIHRMKREHVYQALAFLCPFAVLFFACLNQPNLLGLWGDDGLYFQAAQGLVEGKGYRAFFFPGEPYQTLYPPLYSLSLALFMILGLIKTGDGFHIALPNIVFLSLASLVFYNLFRRRFPDVKPGASLLVTGLVFFHPHLWYLVFLPMSEPLFMLLYLLILWQFERHQGAHDASGFWLGLGCLLGLALLTRTIAVSLVMGATLWLLLQTNLPWTRRLQRALTLVLPAVVFYGIWHVYLHGAVAHNPPTANSILFTAYKGYAFSATQLLSFLPSVVVSNIIQSFESTAGLMLYGVTQTAFLLQHQSLLLVCGTLFLGLCGMGLYAGLHKRGLRPEHLMFAVYLGVVVVVPFMPGRYLIAVIPWFALLFAEAFAGFRKLGKALVVPLLLVCVMQGIGAARFYVRVASQPPASFEFFDVPFDVAATQAGLQWMSDHLPRDAVVAAAKTQMVYLHAHRKAVPPLDASSLAPLFYSHTVQWAWSSSLGSREHVEFIRNNQENIWNAWREIGATHIFFDANDNRSTLDSLANALLINSHLSHLVAIYATPTAVVFEIRY
jgi:4-amino-4-deoxy-L-arabinose transferase-like glycosyltransferase